MEINWRAGMSNSRWQLRSVFWPFLVREDAVLWTLLVEHLVHVHLPRVQKERFSVGGERLFEWPH